MIPAFDYLPELRGLREEIDEAVARVLDSGTLILGPEVTAFENEFAEYVGADAGIGVNSGTDALLLALRAVGVGRGDDVLTVANAGVPPVAAIRAVGATPVFLDVAPDTLLMDPGQLEERRTPRTRAVVPVHLYGQPVDLDPVLEFARRHGLRVIEDCAQAHGALYRGRSAGTFGDVGCFSFYPTKNLGAYGDGGLCVTSDPALADSIRKMRMYGFDRQRNAECEGINSRLDELQAAILRVKLRHLEAATEERRRLAARYTQGIGDSEARPVLAREDVRHVYHLFVVRTKQRDHLRAALQQAGIGSGIHYPRPVHRMPAYRTLRVPGQSLPVTELASAEVLSLPLFPGLGTDAVDIVTARLLDALSAL